MRKTTSKTYLAMCNALLRELRNSSELKLNDRILMMQRLSATYKSLKELHRSGDAINELGAAIKQLKIDMENKKNIDLELVKTEEAING